MIAIEHPKAKGQTLNMRVEGMDCGACALKIENALKRLLRSTLHYHFNKEGEALSECS